MARRLVVLLAAGAIRAFAQQGDLDLGALLGALGGAGGGGGGGPGGGKGGKKAGVCSKGTMPVPKLDQHKLFQSNGCGPQGMEIKEPFGLHRCCNSHDICYTVCGTSHKYCENQFSSCMKEVCKSPLKGTSQECTQQAQGFSGMTQAFGAGFWKKTQDDTCNCVATEEAAEKQRDYLLHFYKMFNASALDDMAAIDEQLTAHRGREFELIFNLVQRLGKAVVQFTVDDVPKEFGIDVMTKASPEEEL